MAPYLTIMPKTNMFKIFIYSLICIAAYADLSSDVAITWGGDRTKQSGDYLQLSLDRNSGSGFQSKAQYLYGRVDMDMKLVPGNSAGTVTTLYLSSQGKYHDEIDFEFLGNVSGQPYTLHTNVFSQGKGDREQQFYLWFDPRADFHKYSILWNPRQIIFYVDNTPIRVFQNFESSIGVPYPKSQPMRLYSSLWDAENWATQGGRVKTDWKLAPFVASYKNFKADACVWYAGKSICPKTNSFWWDHSLDDTETQRLKWVRKNYMIYNYCHDYKRFPQGFPPECSNEISP